MFIAHLSTRNLDDPLRAMLDNGSIRYRLAACRTAFREQLQSGFRRDVSIAFPPSATLWLTLFPLLVSFQAVVFMNSS